MKAVTGALFLVCLAGSGLGQEFPMVPYDSLMEDRADMDGEVDREAGEYPAELKNPATGLTVSWGFDDRYIYCAVETRGRGWFGIGFGAPEMDGSVMVLGFYTEDSSDAYCLVGSGHGHQVAGHLDMLDFDWDLDRDDETGVATLEFACPLTWRGEGAPEVLAGNEVLEGAAIPGLQPGDNYNVILAQNTKSVSFQEKHTHRAGLKVGLAENPKQSSEDE